MKVTDSIHYAGTEDMYLDLFEGQYTVINGISYNSYVIEDEKTAVMDTVDARKTNEWLVNIKNALGGRNPDYLVISHLEPDHSGSIEAFMKRYPQTVVIANAKTFAMLPQFAAKCSEYEKLTVKDGEELSLGKHTLKFYTAPMVHWPEVMTVYEKSEKVLFSADAFGKFGVPRLEEDWLCEARRYYFNIVGKYGAQVQALLKKLAGEEINIICPLHGPVLTENIKYYIDKYDVWSSYQPEDKGIFIAYASIHGNTAKAAKKLAAILNEKTDQKVAIADLSRSDIAECVEDAFRYDRIVLACPTYDGGIFTPMENFINILKSKNYQNRTAAVIENGSWAPTAAKKIKAELEEMKNINILDKTVTIKTRLTAQNEKELAELAGELCRETVCAV